MRAPLRQILDFRHFGIPEVRMLGRYVNVNAGSGLEPHDHEGCIEICFLLRGRQQYRVGDEDFVLRGGDVYVTFPHETHGTGGAPQEKGVLYWVILQPPRSGEAFLGCSPGDAASLVQRLLRLPHRHFAGEPRLRELLDGIFEACEKGDDPLQRIAIQTRIVDFLLRVVACADKGGRTAVSARISAVMRHMEKHTDESLHLQRFADLCGLSLPRFKARFKAEVGMPPAEYAARCRIEAAKKRLLVAGASVTAVAFECGFPSSQYFATVFRRYTGQSPSRFKTGGGKAPD